MAYLNSKNIKVYPTAYRGVIDKKVFNPESRLNTEFNITNYFVNLLTIGENDNTGSFVVSYNDNILKFVIHGYFFEISVPNEFKTGECYGIIRVKALNTSADGDNTQYKSFTLSNVEDNNAILDKEITTGNYEFRALKLDRQSSSSQDTYSLHLLHNNIVPQASKLRLKSENISNGDNNTPINQSFTTGTLSATNVNTTNISATNISAKNIGSTSKKIENLYSNNVVSDSITSNTITTTSAAIPTLNTNVITSNNSTIELQKSLDVYSSCNISWRDISDGQNSGGLKWGGSTDGAEIYYSVANSDEGRLNFVMKDDYNTQFVFTHYDGLTPVIPLKVTRAFIETTAINSTGNIKISSNGDMITLDTSGNINAVGNITTTGNINGKLNNNFQTTTIGSKTTPIFVGNNKIQATDATIGTSIRPIFMQNGALTPLSGTQGSGTKPIYLLNGTLTACSGNVANSGNQLMYMQNGEFKSSAINVGNTNQAVYLNNGTITPITYNSANTNNLYYYSQGVITENSAIIGNVNTPIYKSKTGFSQCTSTFGGKGQLWKVSAGTFSDDTTTIGTTITPVYVTNGKITDCKITNITPSTPDTNVGTTDDGINKKAQPLLTYNEGFKTLSESVSNPKIISDSSSWKVQIPFMTLYRGELRTMQAQTGRSSSVSALYLTVEEREIDF